MNIAALNAIALPRHLRADMPRMQADHAAARAETTRTAAATRRAALRRHRREQLEEARTYTRQALEDSMRGYGLPLNRLGRFLFRHFQPILRRGRLLWLQFLAPRNLYPTV